MTVDGRRRLFDGLRAGREIDRLDEPRRPRGRAARRDTVSPPRARSVPVAGMRHDDASRSTACSSTPRWRTRRAAARSSANFLFDICGASRLDGGRVHRGRDRRRSASWREGARDLRPVRRRGLVGGRGAGAPGRRRPAHLHLRGSRAAAHARARAGRAHLPRAPRHQAASPWTRATLPGALAGVTDPEEKRKRIGDTFIDVFEEAAPRRGEGRRVPGAGHALSRRDRVGVATGGPSVTIKTHHNVGGLARTCPSS